MYCLLETASLHCYVVVFFLATSKIKLSIKLYWVHAVISLARCPAMWAGGRLLFIKPATCWMQGGWAPCFLCYNFVVLDWHAMSTIFGVETDCWFSLAMETRVAGGWQHVKLQDKRKKKTVLPNLLFYSQWGKNINGQDTTTWQHCDAGVASRLIIFDFWFLLGDARATWYYCFLHCNVIVFPYCCFARIIQKNQPVHG